MMYKSALAWYIIISIYSMHEKYILTYNNIKFLISYLDFGVFGVDFGFALSTRLAPSAADDHVDKDVPHHENKQYSSLNPSHNL